MNEKRGQERHKEQEQDAGGNTKQTPCRRIQARTVEGAHAANNTDEGDNDANAVSIPRIDTVLNHPWCVIVVNQDNDSGRRTTAESKTAKDNRRTEKPNEWVDCAHDA